MKVAAAKKKKKNAEVEVEDVVAVVAEEEVVEVNKLTRIGAAINAWHAIAVKKDLLQTKCF